MTIRPAAGREAAEALCLSCGMCCDGTAFTRVPVQVAELDAVRDALPQAAWLPRQNPAFAQPCSAFAGSCTVYARRPQACRAFRCQTLLAVETGKLSFHEAQDRLAQVAAARDALLIAADCLAVPEAEALVHGAKGAVPAFALELLVLGRLVDLHIRPEADRLTMGPPGSPTP